MQARIISNPDPDQPRSLLQASSLHSPVHIGLFYRYYLVPIFLLRDWAFAMMGLALGCELDVRTLFHRVGLRCRKLYYPPFVTFGPVHHANPLGHPEKCTRAHACKRDTESFAASCRWATIFDLEIYRDGWAAGARWASRNSCSCSKE